MAPKSEDLKMIARKTLAAAIVALGALAAVPASAGGFTVQFGYGHPGYGWGAPGHGWGPGYGWHGPRHRMFSPQEVRRILRGDGYRNIRYLDRRGAVYQARASKNGRDFFIVVSARNGQILSRNRI
jgi:hypothetical protein